jgi:hypothetical protein
MTATERLTQANDNYPAYHLQIGQAFLPSARRSTAEWIYWTNQHE